MSCGPAPPGGQSLGCGSSSWQTGFSIHAICTAAFFCSACAAGCCLFWKDRSQCTVCVFAVVLFAGVHGQTSRARLLRPDERGRGERPAPEDLRSRRPVSLWGSRRSSSRACRITRREALGGRANINSGTQTGPLGLSHLIFRLVDGQGIEKDCQGAGPPRGHNVRSLGSGGFSFLVHKAFVQSAHPHSPHALQLDQPQGRDDKRSEKSRALCVRCPARVLFSRGTQRLFLRGADI